MRPTGTGLVMGTLIAASLGSMPTVVGAAVLVLDGAPAAGIIHAEDAAPCVKYAATELQQHVELMTGACLPIHRLGAGQAAPTPSPKQGLVVLGACSAAASLGVTAQGLAPDGFRLRVTDDAIVIVGNDADGFNVDFDRVPASAGTLYGVYRLLERLGVRWFYPGAEGTVAPRSDTLNVPRLNITDAPYFPYRFGGYGKALAPWRRRIGCGGDRDPWSTRHTFNQTVDFWGKYGEEHPEYFCVGRDGKPTQSIALGHPEVIGAIIREAKAFFGAKRPAGKKYFLVIPADGWGYCSCERCAAKLNLEGDPRGQMSNIVAAAAVAVARAVREEFPEGRIVYCAYSNYSLPPDNLERFPDNLVLLIAQPRHGFHNPATRDGAEANVRAWLKLKPPAVYFCRYYGGLRTMTPSFMPGIIAADIKQMKALCEEYSAPIGGEMNFTGVGLDSPHSWWHHLNSYVTAKLLWDPDLSVDDIVSDYCARFYGPAADTMRRFWDMCATQYLDDTQRDVYSVPAIDKLEQLIELAKVQVRDTDYAAKLRFIDRGFDALRMMRAKLRSAQGQVAAATDEALVAHYAFDEPLGDDMTVRDCAGDRHGRARNARTAQGIQGDGLQFTGESSGVNIGACSLAGTDYTIEAWIKPSETLFEGTYFIVGPQMFDRHGLKIVDGRLWLWHRTKDGSWSGQRLSCAGPPMGFIPGRWCYVVGTFSQTDGMALYLDGQLRGLDTTKTEPSVHPVANIGASGVEELSKCFPGVIDEVRLYRRELSAAQVKQRWQEFSARLR